ncbi:hypothetical protein WA538_002590, partial [Blastocystis sp. DL]
MIPIPGEVIPYVTSNPSMVLLLLQILGLREAPEGSRLQPCLIGLSREHLELMFGCTVSVEKGFFNESTYCLSVIFTCEVRCVVLSSALDQRRYITGVVQLQPDTEYEPLKSPAVIPSRSGFYRLPMIGKIAYVKPHPSLESIAADILIASNRHYRFHDRVDIIRELPSSTDELSYFLYRQLLTGYDDERLLFECETGTSRILLEKEMCHKETQIRCKCGQEICLFANCDRLNLLGGNCCKAVFTNRFGKAFCVFTIQGICDCVFLSRLSNEDTWFPGFSWRILGCSSCGDHIGWLFVDDTNRQRYFTA